MTDLWPRRRLLHAGAGLALLPGCARAQPRLTGDFEVETSAGPIRVAYHAPASAHRESPVLMVIHGKGRDADAYLQAWVSAARSAGVLVIAPEFDGDAFEGSRLFNQGGVQDASGRWRPRRAWTFSVVDQVFDAFVRRSGSRQTRFRLFGHSAGAQFVHRYLLFMPADRVELALAANAGWYTLPSRALDYPYGLRDASISEAALRAYLGKPLVLLLGGEDDETDADNLRQTATARLQGPHRLARGRYVFEEARRAAARLGAPFGWRLRIAPGVAHDHVGMTRAAAALALAS